MKIIKLITENANINLASEYYYLTNPEFQNDDIIIIWKNKNSVVIGKNQSVSSEINLLYARNNSINIARRFSGGGAVYQDVGNLCFTFIKRNQRDKFSFKNSLNDIIKFLNNLKVDAYFSGRNDILVANRKVSGNAVYFHKNDYMIHGTLLFDVDVEKLVNVLTVDQSKISSKGIQSVKSRVCNLKDVLSFDVYEFEEKFIKYFERKYKVNCEYVNNSYNDDVVKINENTFNNFQWIYERDFDFNFSNKIKTDSGLLTLKLKTNRNVIVDIDFFSDSLMSLDVKELRDCFISQEYTVENITEILKKIDIKKALEDVTLEQMINLFFAI